MNMFMINTINVITTVDKWRTTQSCFFELSFALLIVGVIRKQTIINMNPEIDNKATDVFEFLKNSNMKETKLNIPISKKNFGHIYLRKVLASFFLSTLLMLGAINMD